MDIILFHTDEGLAAKLHEDFMLRFGREELSIKSFYCIETWDSIADSVKGATFDPFYHAWTQLGSTDIVINVVDHAVRSDEYCYERYHYGLPGLLLANRHFLGNPHIIHVSAEGVADSDSTSDKDLYLLSRNQGDVLLAGEPQVDVLQTRFFSADSVASPGGTWNIFRRNRANAQNTNALNPNSSEAQILSNMVCKRVEVIRASLSDPLVSKWSNSLERRSAAMQVAGSFGDANLTFEPFEDGVEELNVLQTQYKK